MCGKFTARRWFTLLTSFAAGAARETAEDDAGSSADIYTFRPMGLVPVIVFDHETRTRKIVPMRWGMPRGRNSFDIHVHARADRLDETIFAVPFRDGQRGIVGMETFNEGREIVGPKGGKSTEQWVINPQDGQPRGFAFLWREFEIDGKMMLCCVMVTVPASILIEPVTDRMPAILRDEAVSDDWRIWLGEKSNELDEVKAVLQTMEGVRWTMTPEKTPKTEKTRKRQTDEPPQGDLF